MRAFDPLDAFALTTGAAEVSHVQITTIPMLRDRLIKTANAIQRLERCAAAIIPYPGGVIAFGKREDVVDMLKGDEDE